MEKISMNDIIAFIDKAMDKNHIVHANVSKNHYVIISIYNDFNDHCSLIQFRYLKCEDEESFVIDRRHSSDIEIEFTESDILKFELEALKVKEYSKNKLIDYFNDFFKKDSKVIDINDLDNEEE